MKRILVVTERYWPEGGGGTLVTHIILKRMLRLGNVKITVLTEAEKPEKIRGIEYFHVTLSGASKYHAWFNQMRLLQTTSFRNFLKRFDSIYITDHSYPFISVSKMLGKRVIVHLHDYQPICASSNIFASNNRLSLLKLLIEGNFVYELMQRRGYRTALLSVLASPLNNIISSNLGLADYIICVSHRQAKLIREAALLVNPLISSKIHVVYNPLPDDVPFMELRGKDPNFLYVGGGSVVKGVYSLLRAFIRLKKRNPSQNITVTLLDIISSNRWARWYQSNVDWSSIVALLNKGLGRDVFRPMPRLARRDLIKLYSTIWGLVHPTLLEEPSPCSIIEALLAGRPIIAPRVGGIPELVAGTLTENYLYNPNSMEELVDRIDEVCILSAQQISDLGLTLRSQIKRKFKDDQFDDRIKEIFEL
jgi:glycosyltransferase involved in cell wall biosynthesis